MSILKKIKNIKQALLNVYNINNILKMNKNLIINELAYNTIFNNFKDKILNSNELGITTEKYLENDVIISLTSYGKRIHDVCLAIESLMQQTIKPNKIILWLADNEFTLENIPQTLKNLQKRGLTIEFCEDIKSYKKLIPTLIKYPDDVIITIDDDILYPYDMVENLLNSYKENPKLIHFCRGHRMKILNNVLLSYSKWDWSIKDFEIDKLNFPTTGGGTLFPPNSLHPDVTDKNTFMSLAPYADDVWFKAMSLLQGTLSKKSFTRSAKGEDYVYINSEIQVETSLWNNINNLKNDEQIRAVFEKYDIYGLLK